MNTKWMIGCLLCLTPAVAITNAPDESIERGRYLATIGGCHDCHTPGYAENDGIVEEEKWLTGDVLGWRGPWGTTYPVNLRLYMSRLTEEQWLAVARSFRARPPMPWFNVKAMTDDDLRAIYRFVRSLEPLGDPAPVFVPPEKTPDGPYVQFP